MATAKRLMIHIDEELCTGCGNCVPSCAEGALKIIDGKAKVVSESFCDGLGACLGECPEGALTLREVETIPFVKQLLTKIYEKQDWLHRMLIVLVVRNTPIHKKKPQFMKDLVTCFLKLH